MTLKKGGVWDIVAIQSMLYYFHFNLDIWTRQELVIPVSLKMMESINFFSVTHFNIENLPGAFLFHQVGPLERTI